MSRFSGLNSDLAVKPLDGGTKLPEESHATPGRAKAREGKKPVIGYFSEGLSRELRMLAAGEGTTMQALLGEAIDLLMISRNKNRFGER